MDWREGFNESLLDGDALNFLVEHELDEVAGITKRVMDHGLSSISDRQGWVFKTYVVDEWLTRTCRCGNHSLEGFELIGLWMNEGFCGRCADRMAKSRD